MLVLLATTWLLMQMVPKVLKDPAASLVQQVVVVVGVILAILVCFGISLPACLTSVNCR